MLKDVGDGCGTVGPQNEYTLAHEGAKRVPMAMPCAGR